MNDSRTPTILRHLARLLACGLALAASPAAARDDEQIWLNVTAMGPVSGNLLYFAEFQARGGIGDDAYRQLNIRPAVGWRINSQVSAYLGYVYVPTDINDNRANTENRVYQQLGWSFGKTAIGELSSRTRLEQRFRSDGSDTGWRFRQLLRTVVPIQSNPRPIKALATVEVFANLNTTDWGARSGFDQLRSFVGVEIPIQGRSTIEAGYLNQAINRPNADLRVNHVLSIALFIRR